MDGATQKVSYCVLPDEALLRAPAPNPGTLVGAYCRMPLGTVSFVPLVNMAQPGDLWLPNDPPQLETLPISIDWFCDADVGCQARINPPANYHGNISFDYRLRSTSLKDGLKHIRPNDWSEWKSVSLNINSVPDKALVTAVNMAGLDSDQKPIKEDEPFKVTIGRSKGNGKRDFFMGSAYYDGSTISDTDKRVYLSYFDVDNTNDIAVKVIVTGIAKIKDVPVIQKADGSPITVPDDSLFTCDSYGVCTATFLPGDDVNTRSGGDPTFSYKVVTAPVSNLATTGPDRQESAESQISFTIIPADDKPKVEGDGGGGSIPMVEDENNELIIKAMDTVSYLGYFDPDDGDYAEKIEIERITSANVYDPNPTLNLLTREGLATAMGWPNTAPEKLACTLPNGSSTTCIKELNVKEDQPFTIELNLNDYYDPDDDQVPSRKVGGETRSKYSKAIGIAPCNVVRPPVISPFNLEPAFIEDTFMYGTKSLFFSPPISYQTQFEPVIPAVNADPFLRDSSPLLRHRRSKGTLEPGPGGLRTYKREFRNCRTYSPYVMRLMLVCIFF